MKKVSYKGLFQIRDNIRGCYCFEDKRLYLSEKDIGKYAVVNLTTKQVYRFTKSAKKAEHLFSLFHEESAKYEFDMDCIKEYKAKLAKGEKLNSIDKKWYNEITDCYFVGDGVELVEITE